MWRRRRGAQTAAGVPRYVLARHGGTTMNGRAGTSAGRFCLTHGHFMMRSTVGGGLLRSVGVGWAIVDARDTYVSD